MTTLVLTVIGDDRAGLVSTLADVLASHGGSWGRSQLAELAGKFAGIVTVEVPEGRVADLTAALEPLHGVLETTVHAAATDAARTPEGPRLHLQLVGNDRPGIVKEISATLSAHGISIEELETRTASAPMAGGELFEATATLRPSAGSDLDALRSALEQLAQELMVDLTLAPQDGPA